MHYSGCELRRIPLLLDFSHLGSKGVGYARHQSPLKEVIEICAPYLPRWYKC